MPESRSTRSFKGPVVSRVTAGADLRRTEHPAFDVVERRTGVRARVERHMAPGLRVGAEAGRDDVRFGGDNATVIRYLADLVVDTRIDPAFPRNAVWGRAELARLDVATGLRRQHRADANVALGLFAGSALTLRAFQTSANGSLPAYEQAMIGGGPSLRGHRVGYRVDDNAAGASASWALPVGSPLSVARTGVRLFADWAAAYPAGTSWRDASLRSRAWRGLVRAAHGDHRRGRRGPRHRPLARAFQAGHQILGAGARGLGRAAAPLRMRTMSRAGALY